MGKQKGPSFRDLPGPGWQPMVIYPFKRSVHSVQSLQAPTQLRCPGSSFRFVASNELVQGISHNSSLAPGHSPSKLLINALRNGEFMASSRRFFGHLERHSGSSFSCMFRLGFSSDFNLLFVIFCYLSE